MSMQRIMERTKSKVFMLLMSATLLGGCSSDKYDYYEKHYNRELTLEEYTAEYCEITASEDDLEGIIKLEKTYYDLDQGINLYSYSVSSNDNWDVFYIEFDNQIFEREEAKTIIKYRAGKTICSNPVEPVEDADINAIKVPTFKANYISYEIESINYYYSNKEVYSQESKIKEAYLDWETNKKLYAGELRDALQLDNAIINGLGIAIVALLVMSLLLALTL